MGFIDIFIIGLALSMDAFAVCLSSAVIYPGISKRQSFSMPVAFGLFQGIMPVLGYFFGGLFGNLIEKYGGIVACVILVIIGINMIKESFCGEEEVQKKFTFSILMLQAVSTSIDAFATGVSFAAVGANILYASAVIAATTFVMCMLSLGMGVKIGDKLGRYGGMCGGAVLILIGIKSLF